MSQLPAREVNGQYVVSITSPVTGESRCALQLESYLPAEECTYDNYSTGKPQWECQMSDASFTGTENRLTGVAYCYVTVFRRVGNTGS
ncbi:hypothetical protein ECZC06_55160 [Escherichia coli]|nr:hypothetical protein ECZC06_55160 [Escherichia coli]